MTASKETAFHIFGKDKSVASYKAACIRDWARKYLQTGEFPCSYQGKNRKTKSIIEEEYFQKDMIALLRSMKNEERTPFNFQRRLIGKFSTTASRSRWSDKNN